MKKQDEVTDEEGPEAITTRLRERTISDRVLSALKVQPNTQPPSATKRRGTRSSQLVPYKICREELSSDISHFAMPPTSMHQHER